MVITGQTDALDRGRWACACGLPQTGKFSRCKAAFQALSDPAPGNRRESEIGSWWCDGASLQECCDYLGWSQPVRLLGADARHEPTRVDRVDVDVLDHHDCCLDVWHNEQCKSVSVTWHNIWGTFQHSLTVSLAAIFLMFFRVCSPCHAMGRGESSCRRRVVSRVDKKTHSQ